MLISPLLKKEKEKEAAFQVTHLFSVTVSQIQKGFYSCSDRSEIVDHRGKSGKCNMCSAPCSSCFHTNQVISKSIEESAGETCAENIVVDNEMSTVDTMISTSDSSENALCKGFSRTSDASASNEMVVHSKFEAQKIPDDCLSCDSGTNEATQRYNFHNRKVDNRNLPCSSVFTSCVPDQEYGHTIDCQTLSEHGNDKSEVEHSTANHSRLRKINGEFYHKLPSSGLPIGLSSRHPCFSEALDSKITNHGTDLLMVEDTSTPKYSLCDKNSRDMEEDKCSAPHGAHSEVSSEHLNSLLTGDVVTDIHGDLLGKAVNSAEKNVDAGVDMHLVNDTDDSDMVEQDVKVCDICGDAGREDLLAICCRCIDGAEHTYCMREKMAKVPEGDWLCEECKSGEQMRSQRQDKFGKVDGNEKNNSSGQVISEHVNSVDVEGNRSRSSVKIPNKRLRDDADAEVSSIVKKLAVESITRLQKSSWSAKAAAISRENSLKNPEKGRVQSSHGGPSSDAVSVNDNPKLAHSASDRRVHNFQGVFSRSNSFTSINSKPKVKLVDLVLRREKSVKEVAPHQLKDGGIRSLDKSMLFKAKNSIDFESKTKMLSPRLSSHIQDLKNSKQQNTFERQSSFKSKHAPTNSIIDASMDYVSRSDKKQASGGEHCQISTPTDNLETRSMQPDGKSAALSRSYSLSSRKSSDLPSSLGEFKRPALYRRNSHVVLSAKGVNNIDKNSNQSNSKADSSSCSGVSERSPFNADEDQHNGLSQPRESSNSGEPLREQSGSCSRPSYVNSSWDSNNNLKAAIQAAMLRKPGVYQKYRSDYASTSNMGCDIASKDHLSSSAVRRIGSSAAEVVDKCTLSQNLSAERLGQETLNNTKHFPSEPVEASSGGDDTQMLLNWKSSSRDMFSNDAAAMAIFSKSLAIPKHEYIWQGNFDICRSGKIFVSWDGIQAHLSISSSPQVLDVVKKFKNRIVLYEVPRLSTWPIQFQERGVVEDNIALFFFAKDLESYNKIYKVWLENIIQNDLALKGNVNGVELLIFPSNQLPENSQRWNMLFFLWGVFRGKKESRLEYMPENGRSLSPRARDFPACDDVCPDPKLNASVEFCSLLSHGAIDGDCDARVSSVDCLDGRLNSSSSTASRSFSARQCQELRDTCPEEGINLSSGPLRGRSPINVSVRKQMSMHIDTPLGSQHSSYNFDKSLDGVLDISAKKGIEEATMLDKVRSSQDQVKFIVDVNNDAARNQLHGALGKMNHHVASGSREVENQHHDEACNEIVIPGRSEHSKRQLLPMEQSSPWEARSSEQNVLQDRLPDLELALGAERKQKTRATQQVMVGKQERKMTEEYILDETALKEEDDVSSALSLSLSYQLTKEE
ncbi:ASI1-immunoprecipitated protein 2-like isoform X1 [Primulina huaijiensis]|uniref:ASI1-immunoprecipitated protein 2-like isoform X1 n=1 Tax=Primulina huaijiensis TaxID=1492673 RepID=UPI003CC7958B